MEILTKGSRVLNIIEKPVKDQKINAVYICNKSKNKKIFKKIHIKI